MTFDAENRLTAITGGSTSASFVYAVDGSRTVGAVDPSTGSGQAVTMVYIGGIYDSLSIFRRYPARTVCIVEITG